MYKIIACDLDETLLSDDRSISKENIEAIQKAKELGVTPMATYVTGALLQEEDTIRLMEL